MSETIPDDVMKLADETWQAIQEGGEFLAGIGSSLMDKEANVSTAIAQAILADRAGREAEIEEKDERIAELEREAEVISAEFEGDCWRMVRRLLEMTGYDFSHGEGVTAEEAFEHLSEDIKHGSAQIKRASDERDNLRAELSRAKKSIAFLQKSATETSCQITSVRYELSHVKAERDEAVGLARRLYDDFEPPPDPGCTCHVSPPCNDCVEHGHTRELLDEARAFLTRMEARK